MGNQITDLLPCCTKWHRTNDQAAHAEQVPWWVGSNQKEVTPRKCVPQTTRQHKLNRYTWWVFQASLEIVLHKTKKNKRGGKKKVVSKTTCLFKMMKLKFTLQIKKWKYVEDYSRAITTAVYTCTYSFLLLLFLEVRYKVAKCIKILALVKRNCFLLFLTLNEK